MKQPRFNLGFFCDKVIFDQFPIMEEINIQQLQYILTEDLFLIKSEFSAGSPSSSDLQIATRTASEKNLSNMADTVMEPEPISYRGNFQNGVLILHQEEELSTEVMDMLVKMINAVNHSMNEIGMISSKNLEGRTLNELLDLNAHKVLKFGKIKHPIDALPALEYSIHTEDATEYLFADALSVIAEDRNLKLKLWNSLKILFNISKN